MKKLIAIAFVSLTTMSGFSQGTVLFNNRTGGANAPITNIVTGQLVPTGSSYLAQLYYQTAGTTDDSTFVSVATAPVGFVSPGYFVQTVPRVLNNGLTIAGGADAAIQIRAWDAALGATWDVAYAAWLSSPAGPVLGKSEIFTQKTGDASNPTVTPSTLINMRGFYLSPVPEPSVIALGALGLAAILWRRRK